VKNEISFIGSSQWYQPLADDFEPMNVGIVHRFCAAFSKKHTDINSTRRFKAQANASCLLGYSLLVVNFGWTPEEAAELFVGVSSPLKLRPFRDATFSSLSVIALAEV
jgi:hypothetical protein